MTPGAYEVCPVIDGMAAWPWGQIFVKPLTSGRFPISPESVEPAGSNADGTWRPPTLGAVGSNFEEQS